MEQTTFSDALTKIKGAIKSGDVVRLAEKAGYSTQTFRSVFRRKNASELTEAEQHILQVCMKDETIRERIEVANKIEAQAKELTNI